MRLVSSVHSQRLSYFNLIPDPWEQIQKEPQKSLGKYKKKSKVLKRIRVKRQNRIYWREQLVNALENRSQKISASAEKLHQAVKNLPKPPQSQVGMKARPITGFKELGIEPPPSARKLAASVIAPMGGEGFGQYKPMPVMAKSLPKATIAPMGGDGFGQYKPKPVMAAAAARLLPVVRNNRLLNRSVLALTAIGAVSGVSAMYLASRKND